LKAVNNYSSTIVALFASIVAATSRHIFYLFAAMQDPGDQKSCARSAQWSFANSI